MYEIIFSHTFLKWSRAKVAILAHVFLRKDRVFCIGTLYLLLFSSMDIFVCYGLDHNLSPNIMYVQVEIPVGDWLIGECTHLCTNPPMSSWMSALVGGEAWGEEMRHCWCAFEDRALFWLSPCWCHGSGSFPLSYPSAMLFLPWYQLHMD